MDQWGGRAGPLPANGMPAPGYTQLLSLAQVITLDRRTYTSSRHSISHTAKGIPKRTDGSR